MDFCVKRVNVEAEMEKWKDEERMKGEKRWLKVILMNCLLNSNSLLLHLLQIWSSWSITNMAESWVFWTKPILINPPWAAFSFFFSFRSVRQVGTGGLKRNQATVSCWSSQQSYLVWACHLSGQWMHEIREGEEEENVSTTGGEGDKGGRDFGVGGRGGNLERRIKLGRKDSKYRFLRVWEEERERHKRKDRINSDRISLRRGRQIEWQTDRAISRWVIDLTSLTCSRVRCGCSSKVVSPLHSSGSLKGGQGLLSTLNCPES